MFSSPVATVFDQITWDPRSIVTSPVTAPNSAPTTSSGPRLQVRSFDPARLR